MNRPLFVFLTLVCTSGALADVDLVLFGPDCPVEIGDEFPVALVAFNDVIGESQAVATIDAIIQWDDSVISLVGISTTGAFGWPISAFLPDPDGINDPTDDGDALYTALASPATPASVPDTGLLVTTFVFEALTAFSATSIDLVPQQGEFAETRVFAPEPPQTNVTGTITGTTVEIISEPLCPFACGDINGSGGLVNLVDFATFAVCFNLSPLLNVGCACSDLNQDCRINLVDFATFAVLFNGVSTNTIPNCIP